MQAILQTADGLTAGFPGDVPIPCRIIALMQERERLFAYPLADLAAAIHATYFCCDGCGACCTRAVNRHVFLLDHDVTEVR